MLNQPFKRLPTHIQAIKLNISLLQFGHDTQRLGIMVEAAIALHGFVQRFLSGMTESRMAEVMRQRQRLGQFLIKSQFAGDGAANLRHL